MGAIAEEAKPQLADLWNPEQDGRILLRHPVGVNQDPEPKHQRSELSQARGRGESAASKRGPTNGVTQLG